MNDFDDLYYSLEEPDVVDGKDMDDITRIIAYGTALATRSNKRCGPRGKRINRDQQQELWSSGYLAESWHKTLSKPVLALRRIFSNSSWSR